MDVSNKSKCLRLHDLSLWSVWATTLTYSVVSVVIPKHMPSPSLCLICDEAVVRTVSRHLYPGGRGGEGRGGEGRGGEGRGGEGRGGEGRGGEGRGGRGGEGRGGEGRGCTDMYDSVNLYSSLLCVNEVSLCGHLFCYLYSFTTCGETLQVYTKR